MPFFTTKPVTKEAVRWDGYNEEELRRFMQTTVMEVNQFHQPPSLVLKTNHGQVEALPGDWVIKGHGKEFYPCSADVFEKTYSPAGDPNKP